MKRLLLLLALASCRHKVATKPPEFDAHECVLITFGHAVDADGKLVAMPTKSESIPCPNGEPK